MTRHTWCRSINSNLALGKLIRRMDLLLEDCTLDCTSLDFNKIKFSYLPLSRKYNWIVMQLSVDQINNKSIYPWKNCLDRY